MPAPLERLVRASEIFRDTIWDAGDRPFRLWGAVPPLPRVAIVGSRRASASGLKAVRLLAEDLARAGVTVVSGGAVGIDRAAHEGALQGGGQTLVMAPSGLDAPFPKQNYELFLKIIDHGGGVLTHCAAGHKAGRAQFLRRNAQMVALSDCIVLGEFSARSGARNTWSHARRAGKATFVLPSEFGCISCEGSLEALESSETISLGRSSHLLQFLREQGFLSLSEAKQGSEAPRQENSDLITPTLLRTWGQHYLKDTELEVFIAVLDGARSQEEVVEKLQLSPFEYQSAYCRLQLEGCLVEDLKGHLSVLNPRRGR